MSALLRVHTNPYEQPVRVNFVLETRQSKFCVEINNALLLEIVGINGYKVKGTKL